MTLSRIVLCPNDWLCAALAFSAFVVVTILYYVLFSSLGKGNGGGGGSLGDSPGSGSGSGEAPGKRTLEVILWSIFIILIINVRFGELVCDFYAYFFLEDR